jgi:hypothetical protein
MHDVTYLSFPAKQKTTNKPTVIAGDGRGSRARMFVCFIVYIV